MMIDENGPKVIEMNTNPGITEFSNIPAQAKAMGISLRVIGPLFKQCKIVEGFGY